jgi:hypothetical protein
VPLYQPFAAAPTADGGLVIFERTLGRVRHLSSTGELSTIATLPDAIVAGAIDPAGNVVVATDEDRFFLLAAGDAASPAPGSPPLAIGGTGLPGVETGPFADARVAAPETMTFDDDGNLYLGYRDAMRVLRVRVTLAP